MLDKMRINTSGIFEWMIDEGECFEVFLYGNKNVIDMLTTAVLFMIVNF